MKHTTLAITISSLFFTGLAGAATVYDNNGTTLKIGGRAEARFEMSKAYEDEDNSTFQDKSRARIKLKGTTKITDELSAFGVYELEVKDDDDKIKNRYLYAGLKTQAGKISYGKQDSAQVIIRDFTDIMTTGSGDASEIISGSKDKRENNFVYNNTFNDITLTANYVASSEKDKSSYGASATYQSPMGFALGAGYVTDTTKGADDSNQYTLAANYDNSGIYLAGLYTVASEGKKDTYGYELAAGYKVNKLSLNTVYNKQTEEDIAGKASDKVEYIAAEAIYKFNKHFRTYIGHQFNQLENGEDTTQVGIRYTF